MTVHDGREEGFGRYFEDLEIGDVFRHWPGQTITQAADHLFCSLTSALSPIHVDSHYAQREMSGGRNIVVGTLIYSLLVGMSVPDISGKAIAALGTESLRHIAPVHHGDTIYGETTVVAKRVSQTRPAAGIVTVETRGFRHDEVLVCEFRRSFLVPLRASLP